MALSERLALLVSLDANGAVRGLNNVGRTADRELGKAEHGSARMAQGFQKAGVGMLATGGLVIGGLFKLAKKSEEAALSTHKLENSIQNNAKLAGHSVSEFTDLADAISKKTAADNDDIVAGQAVLAQFKLEADQVKELTPLIVDLSRKKGIGLAAAATLAAKAVDGNSGALKRQGIAVDEAAFKTDAYTATVDALKGSVGGFAEQEGKTFAGSLERAKNQLGDIAEGVGVGAVDAFTDLLDPVTKAAAKFKEMDPAAQSLIGKFATFGAVGLTAAGGLTFAIGKLTQMRDTLAPLGGRLRNAEGGLTRLGKAGVFAAGAFAGFELIQLGRELDGLHVDANSAAGGFAHMTDAVKEQTIQQLRLAEASGGLDDLIGAVAESSVPAAERLLAFAEANGFAKGEVEDLAKIIEEKRGQDVQGAKDQEVYASEVDEAADATGGLTEKLNQQEEALQGVLDATLAQFDANLGYRRAVDDVEDSLSELLETQKAHGSNSEEYRDKLLDTEGALLDQAAAAVRLRDDMATAAGQTLSAKDKTSIYKDELIRLRSEIAPGSPLRNALDAYIRQLESIPASISTSISYSRPTRNPDARASGGPVSAGSTYLVGERGPELLTVGSSGYVTPNSALSGGDTTIVIPVSIGGYEIDRLIVDANARTVRRGYAA